MNKAVFDLCGDLEGVEVYLTDVRNALGLFIGGFEGIQETVNTHFPKCADVCQVDFKQLGSLLFMAMRSFDESLCELRGVINQRYNISRTPNSDTQSEAV